MGKTKPAWQKKIASERIERLFELASEAHSKSTGMADRYVGLARQIAMHYKVGIPRSLKGRYCRKCGSFMVSGSTSSVRTRTPKKVIVTKCKKCDNIQRFPYSK